MKKRIFIKTFSVFVSLNLLFQTFYPTVALALTGGPTQPEFQGFEPVGNTEMVNLSSGSFTYNIPLMDVEGYPINLSYHSGITMDQEASWVGLGWNINPGEINRQMRGLPDDFDGDLVTKQFNIKDNITEGINFGAGVKVVGLPIINGISGTVGLFYNNYTGPGLSIGIDPSIGSGNANKGPLTARLGFDFNSKSGVDVQASIGAGFQVWNDDNYNIGTGITVGTSYNSRTGIQGLYMSKDLGVSNNYNPDNSAGLGVTTTMSFSAPSYIPTIDMPMLNNAYALSATAGGELFGIHPDLTTGGFLNFQTLATHKITTPAFGYMNAEYSNHSANVLLDFNRDEDVPYQPHIQNLPITNFTFDLFNVNGQGVSGQYRPFRGDVGVLYDCLTTNQASSYNLGVGLGGGNIIHGGIDVQAEWSTTTTDEWTGDNNLGFPTNSSQALQFLFPVQPNTISYEPSYFKEVGEKTINDQGFYNQMADVDPTCVELNQSGSTVSAMNSLLYQNTSLTVGANILRTRRDKRNQLFSVLTAREANFFALDKTINSYPFNTNVYGTACTGVSGIDTTSRLSWPHQHISEITVTQPDGRRYIYGVPSYNKYREDASFAVATPSNANSVTGTSIVKYAGGTKADNSISNQSGFDNYFSEDQIPAYSNSFLLTGVLSPDYVDMTGNGITDDDMGKAVKINYTRVYNTLKGHPYNWRVPVGLDTAVYQQRFKSTGNYDRANYIYGQKDIWYVHSIESKTMVAQFILQKRLDGLGVKDRNGQVNPLDTLECLKEIILYSKADLIKNGAKAVPIKTAHFEYNYSLCPGTPNSMASGKGKLTLSSVYFTYGNNTEGSINSYVFNYSSYNPNYGYSQYDRWGYYKVNPGTSTHPNNIDFPYTDQDSLNTNIYATAWELTGIDLPSGGKIKVNYQANDYAYVQNQRAGEMFIPEGFSNTATDSATGSLYTRSSSYSFLSPIVNSNNWIHFNGLPVPAYSAGDFEAKYLSGVMGGNNELYFRVLTDVGGNGQYEYVPGYASVLNCQEVGGNPHNWAIELAPYGSGALPNIFMNPIAVAAWQYERLNLPQYAYPGSNTKGEGPLKTILSLIGSLGQVISTFEGFDNSAISNSAGQYTHPQFSYFRLSNPNYKKLGGGCRVSEIDISDSWSSMVSGQSSFTYGQTYNYTTTLNGQPNGQVISSGVASYEPLMGGDENSLHQPLNYEEKYILAPNNAFYTETPYGESLYPSPEITYSQVTVTNLKYPGVSRTATGYTINKFYTAFDFPVQNPTITTPTCRVSPSLISTILDFSTKDYTTVSQGFNIEVNDMAGKERGKEVYDANGSEVSSIYYYYNVDNPNPDIPSMHLANNVNVVNPDGSISNSSIGKDIDMWEDMREQHTETYNLDGQVNFDFSVAGFIPLPFPSVWGSYSSEKTRFRSSVTTKFIHRSGILDSIVKTDNGSTVKTQNLLFDAETGDVLLTETNNEFNAPVYNFTYPAHWAYDGMGSAYQNIGAIFQVDSVSKGTIVGLSSPGQYFVPGDELEWFSGSNLFNSPNAFKFWVTQPQSQLVIMDQNGNPANIAQYNASHVSSPIYLKIIRSGRRNMQGIPVGAFSSLLSPEGNNSLKIKDSLNILQADATLYNNAWKIPVTNLTFLSCVTIPPPSDTCMSTFLYALHTHRKYFASIYDDLKFGYYVSSCSAYSNDKYYSLSDSFGYSLGSGFSAELGGCAINIDSYHDKNLSIDSLTPYKLKVTYYTVADSGTRITVDTLKVNDTTGGCLNLYYTRYKDTAIFEPMFPSCIHCYDCFGSIGIIGVPACFNCGTCNNGGLPNENIPLCFHSNCTGLVTIGVPYSVLKAAECMSCKTCSEVCENLDSIFNPYAVGLLGDWRQQKEYVYYDDRSPAFNAPKSNIWENGIYNDFTGFWDKPSGGGTIWDVDTSDKNWTWTTQMTTYDQKGNLVENVDHLGRYSSSEYGYIQSLPVAIASNASYREIAFDGFEDYGFTNNCGNRCDNSHFSFLTTLDPPYYDTSSAESHTGNYSFRFKQGANINATVSKTISYPSSKIDSTTATKFYVVKGTGIPLFSPDSGQYILSAWVLDSNSSQCNLLAYTGDSVEVSFTGSSVKYNFAPLGPVIEGWQQVNGKFKVPKNATSINVTLHPNNVMPAYFDDIRLQPYKASMKSYVYDASSLRTMSVLDEYNYATFYEYNDEGILQRVKKETDRGIMTIKESRSSYPRD